MPRITLYEDLPDPTPEQRAIHQAILDGPRGKLVGPLRAVLRVPALAGPWQEIGAHLRYRTALTPRQSELVILGVARHWSSELEWSIHAHRRSSDDDRERDRSFCVLSCWTCSCNARISLSCLPSSSFCFRLSFFSCTLSSNVIEAEKLPMTVDTRVATMKLFWIGFQRELPYQRVRDPHESKT